MKVLDSDFDYIYSKLGKNTFKDSKILITGGAGFIGFYLVNFLCKYRLVLGINKIVVLDAFLLNKPEWLENLRKDNKFLEVFKFVVGRDSFGEINGNNVFTHVIHMASIASPTFYRKYPLETIDTNVWGLRNLLDSFKTSEFLKSFVFMSSSEIYGDPDPDYIPTPESYRGIVSCVGPRSCYDESKRFGETLCSYYSQIYDLNISMVRPFNNYGPGLSLTDRRLPADFAKCIVENKDLVLYSDGTPTRTFCYIADAVIGYLKVLGNCFNGPINIGSDSGEISVLNMAKLYKEIAQSKFDYTGEVKFASSQDSNYLTDNPSRRVPEISLARRKLNYDPTITNEQGIAKYLTFLKEINKF